MYIDITIFGQLLVVLGFLVSLATCRFARLHKENIVWLFVKSLLLNLFFAPLGWLYFLRKRKLRNLESLV